MSISPKQSIADHVRAIVALQKEHEASTTARYSIYPVKDMQAFEFLSRQEAIHWTDTEIDFVADISDYEKATPNERRVIDLIMAFFLTGDGIVSDNIVYRFMLECRSYEEKSMFISQLHIELVHALTYGMAVMTFKRNEDVMQDLLSKVDAAPCVQAKVKFMEKWLLSDAPRYQRLVAFACAEGIFFCTLFAIIFWFDHKRPRFPSFMQANGLIRNDESLHRDWGIHLFQQEVALLLQKVPTSEHQKVKSQIASEILEIIKDAVAVEDLFVESLLEEPLEDLNITGMKAYARLITNNLLVSLGYDCLYPKEEARNVYTWLDSITGDIKTNFFEKRVTNYSQSVEKRLNWRLRAGLEEPKEQAFQNPQDVDF